MQARNAPGCGLIDSPDALAALKGIRTLLVGAREHRRGQSSDAGSDGSGVWPRSARRDPMVRAADLRRQWTAFSAGGVRGRELLAAVSAWEDVKSSAQSESYEGAWKLIDALRTLSTRDFDGYDHLQWVQISGPGSTEDSEPRTWRELTQAAHVTPQNAPAVRAAAMG
jgi:hypothetical protein